MFFAGRSVEESQAFINWLEAQRRGDLVTPVVEDLTPQEQEILLFRDISLGDDFVPYRYNNIAGARALTNGYPAERVEDLQHGIVYIEDPEEFETRFFRIGQGSNAHELAMVAPVLAHLSVRDTRHSFLLYPDLYLYLPDSAQNSGQFEISPMNAGLVYFLTGRLPIEFLREPDLEEAYSLVVRSRRIFSVPDIRDRYLRTGFSEFLELEYRNMLSNRRSFLTDNEMAVMPPEVEFWDPFFDYLREYFVTNNLENFVDDFIAQNLPLELEVYDFLINPDTDSNARQRLFIAYNSQQGNVEFLRLSDWIDRTGSDWIRILQDQNGVDVLLLRIQPGYEVAIQDNLEVRLREVPRYFLEQAYSDLVQGNFQQDEAWQRIYELEQRYTDEDIYLGQTRIGGEGRLVILSEVRRIIRLMIADNVQFSNQVNILRFKYEEYERVINVYREFNMVMDALIRAVFQPNIDRDIDSLRQEVRRSLEEVVRVDGYNREAGQNRVPGFIGSEELDLLRDLVLEIANQNQREEGKVHIDSVIKEVQDLYIRRRVLRDTYHRISESVRRPQREFENYRIDFCIASNMETYEGLALDDNRTRFLTYGSDFEYERSIMLLFLYQDNIVREGFVSQRFRDYINLVRVYRVFFREIDEYISRSEFDNNEQQSKLNYILELLWAITETERNFGQELPETEELENLRSRMRAYSNISTDNVVEWRQGEVQRYEQNLGLNLILNINLENISVLGRRNIIRYFLRQYLTPQGNEIRATNLQDRRRSGPRMSELVDQVERTSSTATDIRAIRDFIRFFALEEMERIDRGEAEHRNIRLRTSEERTEALDIREERREFAEGLERMLRPVMRGR